MNWRGKTIVDISRAFLDTNGAHQEANVVPETPVKEGNLFVKKEVADVKATWLNDLSDLNVCSQKGLVEMFDGSIGAGSYSCLRRKVPADRDSRPWLRSFRF